MRRLRHETGEDDDDEGVAVLDRDNYEDRVGEVTWTFIHFHTDWCRHCKVLEETWEDLAAQFKGEYFKIKNVVMQQL